MEKVNEKSTQRLISLQEAARYLGTTANTLRRKTKDNAWRIPEVVMSGRIKFDIHDLDEFIQSRKVVNNRENLNTYLTECKERKN